VTIVWRFVSRYRRVLILALALLVAFVLMTVQVRHDHAALSFARQAILFVVSPFIKVTAVAAGGLGRVWHDYVDLRALREENQRLQRESAILQRRISQLEEHALETQRLQGLLAMRETSRANYLAARIVGKDATNWFKTILIDRGSQAGLRRNFPVVAPEGLVGRVVEVTPYTAKVQLLTDPVSASGGLLQRMDEDGQGQPHRLEGAEPVVGDHRRDREEREEREAREGAGPAAEERRRLVDHAGSGVSRS